MARIVRAKAAEKEQTRKDTGKRVQKVYEFQHSVIVSLNDGFRDVTWDQMLDTVREALAERFPGGRVTSIGGHILIDGKACYPHDFDYELMDRKPGTFPPPYTLTDEEKKQIGMLERINRERKAPEMARNPEHMLTTGETSALRRIRAAKNGVKDPRRPPAPVIAVAPEWTEQDADDEALVERETAKLLKRIPVKKPKEPVRVLRRPK
jgi:hypothetical protein